MNEPAPGTPEYNDKKWKPLTEGFTRREAVYTATVLENEARFLHAQQEAPLAKKTPIPGLKYIFPTIRKAVPNLLDGDLTEDSVRDQFRQAATDVLTTDSTRHGVVVNEMPSPEEIAEFIDPVAARAKTSIEGLRDIL